LNLLSLYAFLLSNRLSLYAFLLSNMLRERIEIMLRV